MHPRALSKNRVTYTKRPVSYGVLSHFSVALLLLFHSVQVIGSLLCGSSFGEVVFQSGMIKAGCIKGVLSGYDYNSAWIVHNVVSEALERLQLTFLLTEVSGENILWLK